MDNILVKKIYEDNEIIEIEVVANNDYVVIRQSSYVSEEMLDDISKKIINYSKSLANNCYIEIGNKDGKCAPAFSIEFMKPDVRGHILIEMDMEICDNDDRRHRCKFYVKSELGLVGSFAVNLMSLIKCRIDDAISMNN